MVQDEAEQSDGTIDFGDEVAAVLETTGLQPHRLSSARQTTIRFV